MNQMIRNFSRLTKEEKTELITKLFTSDAPAACELLSKYNLQDPTVQSLHDGFAENTLANYYIPYSVAPNVMVNGRFYCVPMAIEESSVVAAASKSASFWAQRGGFKASVEKAVKKGQIHLYYKGDKKIIFAFFEKVKDNLLRACEPITKKMTERGGGITSLALVDKTDVEKDYFQIDLSADTMDSMGANFINSTLECLAQEFKRLFEEEKIAGELQIIMCILSNYTPECVAHVEVSAPVDDMADGDMSGSVFCEKFVKAVRIAHLCTERAVTHNKGIMNGVDAVVIATGNDFRAVEACAHAYAGREGRYSSLSTAEVKDGVFRFWMDVPLAIGTVGGLTRLHPLAGLSMDILGNPSAKELMMITASVGLAQNFGAVRSLVTSGIQRGHMKMHLNNILLSMGASTEQMEKANVFFKDKIVSHSAVEEFLKK
ncbi:MAG: hydroxymethylglutaryl-CoA reductase [Flavobacteriales bacterium]|nr:hydroxymethylglutaryl-CoA reductase [Flavobacteriales bacterium]